MKCVTIVGARPQFVKAAAVSRKLRKANQEILVHTGQHYDLNMSEFFFEELNIPKPDYNLGVGSKTHARQTAEMMVGIEDILLKEKPDVVLVYGDTNSTLAAALTAGKLCVPIAHVEAGGRTFVKDMPEEQNRIVTDHLATWNFCPSEVAEKYLEREGIRTNVYNVGDVMYDVLLYYSKISEQRSPDIFWQKICPWIPNQNRIGDKWYLVTMHRPENVDDPIKLISILEALQDLDHPVIFPVHPRTQQRIKDLHLQDQFENIHFIEPLGYIEMLYFAKNAVRIITDSGGLHKEAFLLKVPGVVVLRGTGWEETLNGNCNVLAKPDRDDIVNKVLHTKIDYNCFNIPYYGDGTAADKIVKILTDNH